jgi:GT2 family glycosyltransferase
LGLRTTALPGSNLAQAINYGAALGGTWDWLLWLANDNIVEGPFLEALSVLDPMTVYHRKLVTNDEYIWGDGGQMLVSRALWEKVGPLDERLRGGSEFMDLDYTMRARAHGGWVGRMNLPIRNLPITIRLDTEAGRQAREFNRQLVSNRYDTDLTKMHG